MEKYKNIHDMGWFPDVLSIYVYQIYIQYIYVLSTLFVTLNLKADHIISQIFEIKAEEDNKSMLCNKDRVMTSS